MSHPDPTEVLTLPDPRRGWRGVPPAEIMLAALPGGRWMSAASVSWPGNYSGYPLAFPRSEPVTFATRADALAAAIAFVARRVEQDDGAECRRIRAWLEEVTSPPQPDLFGAAA